MTVVRVMLTERGTRLYSAPELRFGRMWNERVDIWACGLSFFFMLRSCLPFALEDPETAKSLLSGTLPNIRWGLVPELMGNLIRQCLTVRMQDRPPAMELLMHPLFSDSEKRLQENCSPKRNSCQPFELDEGDARSQQDWSSCGEEHLDLYAMSTSCGMIALSAHESQGGSYSSEATRLSFDDADCVSPVSLCGGNETEVEFGPPSSRRLRKQWQESSKRTSMLRHLAKSKYERSSIKALETDQSCAQSSRSLSPPPRMTF